MNKSITVSELVELMDNVWSTTRDIQRIGSVGINRAYAIRDEIRQQMKEAGAFVPRYKVSTEYVIKYFKLDEKKIRRQAMGGIINEQ